MTKKLLTGTQDESAKLTRIHTRQAQTSMDRHERRMKSYSGLAQKCKQHGRDVADLPD